MYCHKWTSSSVSKFLAKIWIKNKQILSKLSVIFAWQFYDLLSSAKLKIFRILDFLE